MSSATFVSVLFSEPKISQSIANDVLATGAEVSVLFSEPKISQFSRRERAKDCVSGFQCSSASRKFLNRTSRLAGAPERGFQCSSASRKFLNRRSASSASSFQRSFSALQRAENFSIPTLAPASIHIPDRDDHASSFLSLPGVSL